MIHLVQNVGNALNQILEAVEWPEATAQQADAPESARLWRRSAPRLERALAVYDKFNSSEMPERTLPEASRTGRWKEMEKVLDAVIEVLEASGPTECRRQIWALRQQIAAGQQKIAELREEAALAPTKAALYLPCSMWVGISSFKPLRIAPRLRLNLSKAGPRSSLHVPDGRASVGLNGKVRFQDSQTV